MHLGTHQPTKETTTIKPKEAKGHKKKFKKSTGTGGTSSPIKSTEGSADISSSNAEFNASRTVIYNKQMSDCVKLHAKCHGHNIEVVLYLYIRTRPPS